MRSVRTVISILSLAAVAVSTAGCFTLGTNNVTEDRLDRGLIIYVEDSSDARNRGWKSFEQGLSNRGVSLAVDNFDWSPQIRQIPGVGIPDRGDSGEAARDLARSIRHYGLVYPGRPLHVVAHGVGCHLALNALEHLDPRFGIDRLVLLSPNVDYYRNLSTPLTKVRDRCVAYYSWGDILHGAVGGFVFGTHDTARARAHAATLGFRVPEDADMEEYEKLHAYGWRPGVVWRGHFGLHNMGPTSPMFVRKFIVPFLLDGTLIDASDDDFGPVPD